MIGQIIGAFLVILVGFTLLLAVETQITEAQASLNETTGTKHPQTYEEYVQERLEVERMMK